jgi:hypothetical protein
MLRCENSANSSSPVGDGQKISVMNCPQAHTGFADLFLSRQDFLLAWSEACQAGLIGHDDVAPFVLSLLADIEQVATNSGVPS